MTEYHCEFCNATGTKLRNEEKGCCNNCGAPIGITKAQVDNVYERYFADLSWAGTATRMPYPLVEVTSMQDHKRKFIEVE